LKPIKAALIRIAPGGDLAHGDGGGKLRAVQPVQTVHHQLLDQGDEHETAAEQHQAM
jgi:hypothetical protein